MNAPLAKILIEIFEFLKKGEEEDGRGPSKHIFCLIRSFAIPFSILSMVGIKVWGQCQRRWFHTMINIFLAFLLLTMNAFNTLPFVFLLLTWTMH